MQRAWQKLQHANGCSARVEQLLISWRAAPLAKTFGVSMRRRQFLFQLMDLLTERRLRYVLALRRVREATLLRDSDKVSELMNFHRRSDTPLGPPVCLRPADRHFWIRPGSIRASRVVLGALAEQLFLISDL